MCHFIDYGPKPALESCEPVGLLAALVVEAGVGDERGHVDVAHAVQQQPQVLRRQTLQSRFGQHVQDAVTDRLNNCQIYVTIQI